SPTRTSRTECPATGSGAAAGHEKTAPRGGGWKGADYATAARSDGPVPEVPPVIMIGSSYRSTVFGSGSMRATSPISAGYTSIACDDAHAVDWVIDRRITTKPAVSRTNVVKIVSPDACFFSRSFVELKLVRPLTFDVNVLASELVSTAAVSGWKPFRPSAVRVDVRSIPAFSSVVVGAAWLAMVVTQ